jgi:hypothetical protein
LGENPLIRINVHTCHIGQDSNNSPKRLFFVLLRWSSRTVAATR